MVLPVKQIPNENNSGASEGRPNAEQPCICLFSALYAPSTGGVEGYTQHLAHTLASMGWRVIVVAMNTHGREGYTHEAAEVGTPSLAAEARRSAEAQQPAGAQCPAGTQPPAQVHQPTESYSATQSEGLAEACPSANWPIAHQLASAAEQPLVEVVRLPCQGLLNGRYPVPRKNAEFRALWRWLESQHINYVVVNTRFYLLSQMGMEFAQSKGLQPVVVEHGSAHLTMGNLLIDKAVQATEHSLTRKVASYPASFYGVSQQACNWLRHFGIAAGGVLPNAIDADEFAALAQTCSRNFRQELGLPDNAIVLAFVGRLVPEKGVLALAEAVNALETDRPVALLIAGDGPLAQPLLHKDTSRIALLGPLERNHVAALLAQADLLCLPSRSEGFATVLLEAAAVGTPALATPVGGTDELIPSPEYGFIVPDSNASTLKTALEQAIREPHALATAGCNVAKRVREHFSWKATADALVAACQNEPAPESSPNN